jgi:accessory gene regulator protein AgrB
MHKNYYKVRYISNPYIRFGNQVAILRGRIKESQVSMASRYTYIRHYSGSAHATYNIKINRCL